MNNFQKAKSGHSLDSERWKVWLTEADFDENVSQALFVVWLRDLWEHSCFFLSGHVKTNHRHAGSVDLKSEISLTDTDKPPVRDVDKELSGAEQVRLFWIVMF